MRLRPAHFNPQELNVLDHLQGGREVCKRSGCRRYGRLEPFFENPHLQNQRKSWHQQNRSTPDYPRPSHPIGGTPMTPQGAQEMASHGRHGDTEVALIGPHLQQSLDQMAGQKDFNAQDGHPQYASLTDMFKWLGGMLGKVGGYALHPSSIPGGVGGFLGETVPHMLGAAATGLSAYGAGKKLWNALQGLSHPDNHNPLGMLGAVGDLYSQMDNTKNRFQHAYGAGHQALGSAQDNLGKMYQGLRGKAPAPQEEVPWAEQYRAEGGSVTDPYRLGLRKANRHAFEQENLCQRKN